MPGQTSVLIIDDDPDDRELLIEAIKEFDPGTICNEATGSLDALKILSTDQILIPDYIFLDLNMPLMNGKECLAEIMKIPHIDESKVVIYTTSQREDDARELLAMGAVFFLIKPSVFSELKMAVQYILSGEGGVMIVNGLLKQE
jgi:CheY-like chemotaxis protein